MVENMKNRRPWGYYEILLDSPDVKVKKISIEPGHSISYQSHEKRCENWIVVSGNGLLTLNEKDSEVCRGDYVFINYGEKHRIKCTSEKKLEFIEVQIGTYFGEDDIKRFADDYGRK